MAEKAVITIKSIKPKKIEFTISNDVNEFKVFDIEKNIVLDQTDYSIEKIGQVYNLNIDVNGDFYFYGTLNGVETNYMYFFKNNIVLGEEFLYKEFIIPKEGLKGGEFDKIFFNEKEFKSVSERVKLSENIDALKSYFNINSGDDTTDIDIKLYTLDDEKINKKLKVKIIKVR